MTTHCLLIMCDVQNESDYIRSLGTKSLKSSRHFYHFSYDENFCFPFYFLKRQRVFGQCDCVEVEINGSENVFGSS